MTTDTPERITRAEAADRLGVSLATIDRYLADDRLTRVTKIEITNRVLLDADQVEQIRRSREGT